jgi:asparagine synthase (glutamine-hydrolysing)
MCGILGTIDLTISENILASLQHRGPDGQGIKQLMVCNHVVRLGHTRLSILDLSPAGQQPMQSNNGRWWVTFNGEIYNHLELRKSLQSSFLGHADTETLIELIANQGVENTLPKINGMFAFAALDTQEGKLYLVRDPFGIKPLYYARKGKQFAFASEARVLKELGHHGGADSNTLQLFLTLRYVPSPLTLWKNINRLQPGHILCIDLATGEMHNQNYAVPTKIDFTGNLQDATEQYKELLGKAVKRQLLSDVPVGILLSGGIDSALVAAMAKDSGRDLPCFTVGFGKDYNECELADAEETARVLGLPITSVTVTPEMLLDALPSIVRSVEEPLGTTSIMPMWYLVRCAQEQVTVVLTGQGTDEPWGGYRRYQMEMIRQFAPWPSFWKVVANVGTIAGRSLPEVLERGLRSLPVTNFSERTVEACALFSSRERELLTGSRHDGNAVQTFQYWVDWMQQANCSPAETMMRVDTRTNLADDLLIYGDKISMATSLEARVPMLDIELVQFVESLPLNFRVALRKTKIVHKLMAERYLPSSIVHRPKKGFSVPFGNWTRGVWRSYIEETLLAKEAPHWAMLDRKGVLSLWTEHLSAKPDRSRQIFALFMLAIWWKQQ